MTEALWVYVFSWIMCVKVQMIAELSLTHCIKLREMYTNFDLEPMAGHCVPD